MKRKVTLIADKGMVLTNGKDCCEIAHLAVGADESVYYEITEEESKDIMAKEAAKRRDENSPV